ncbi:MptD family putative ECF transporter S component [Sneathia sanguinegens]|jgi:hypothetical protein|uniref:MptD family putative ECF transporter S component n=2 Tax=Sneathia sanguinegens TaxID=40543 RepID=UPI00083310A5|nr:MptD family putative ECF transporter S component [Sneathia sanguinegens]MDU7496333.1 MptD family putative ECF transporter S component [Sneathia sanguinegens]
MENNKLTVRDLTNIGLFSVLIFVLTFLSSIIMLIPFAMPILPFVIGILTGPVYMIYSTKIKKVGMIFIQQIILALIFVSTGHGPFILLTIGICSIIAELIIRKGGYKSLKYSRLAFTITPIGYIGNFIPLLISRDKIYAKLVASEGVEFANQFMSSVPNWMVIPCILLAMLGGFLGCTIGIVILKKHFEKAGMLK